LKIALVQMPVWWPVDPPLGLAQAAGCLKAAGHEVSVFDLNIRLWRERAPQYANLWLWEQFHFWNDPALVDRFFEDNRRLLDDAVERILAGGASVVGFSVHDGAQLASLRLARRLKDADPSRRVVFGGQYFFRGDAVQRVLAEGSPVDAVVRGAADAVLPDLVEELARSGTARARPGVAARRDGRVEDGGPAPLPRSLDGVPFADFTGFPMELYEDTSRIPLAASRGCVWACRFCSTREFWTGYSHMSGDRIFAEVVHQRRLFPSRRHVEFYDITANGRPEALERFCDLMIDARLGTGEAPAGWKVNAILRPEMTRGLLRKMKAAGCTSVIYGVESGSPRVLKLMNKNYSVDVAEAVLHETRAAGLFTTANFMVGFPGETEEDFQLTLAFLERNRGSLDRAYSSATFTSLEAHSYLTEHAGEFGVGPGPDGAPHNLFWSTSDGRNSYPVRLRRYKRFRALAIRLGVDPADGVNGPLPMEILRRMADYYHYTGDFGRAARSYKLYLDHDPRNEAVLRAAGTLRRELSAPDRRIDPARRQSIARRLDEALAGRTAAA
jgi:radical SAM superfamily enzyme YgiQ (UPF0313 family)